MLKQVGTYFFALYVHDTFTCIVNQIALLNTLNNIFFSPILILVQESFQLFV
jgi:hypothetical protein